MFFILEIMPMETRENKGFFGVGCDISGLDVTPDVTLKRRGKSCGYSIS